MLPDDALISNVSLLGSHSFQLAFGPGAGTYFVSAGIDTINGPAPPPPVPGLGVVGLLSLGVSSCLLGARRLRGDRGTAREA